MLVIDDTGDRKDGRAINHVARQYLGSVEKIHNGIVAVTRTVGERRVLLHAACLTLFASNATA